MCNELKLL